MVYIHWITGTASLGRVFGRMELLTMVIVLGESQFSTQILLKIKQFEKMKLFPVLDVLIFKLGPLLLFYNEGVDDLVDCERMRKLDGNILPCIPSFKMVLIDDCPAFQMVLTDVHHYIFSRWVCIRIIRSEGAI